MSLSRRRLSWKARSATLVTGHCPLMNFTSGTTRKIGAQSAKRAVRRVARNAMPRTKIAITRSLKGVTTRSDVSRDTALRPSNTAFCLQRRVANARFAAVINRAGNTFGISTTRTQRMRGRHGSRCVRRNQFAGFCAIAAISRSVTMNSLSSVSAMSVSKNIVSEAA